LIDDKKKKSSNILLKFSSRNVVFQEQLRSFGNESRAAEADGTVMFHGEQIDFPLNTKDKISISNIIKK
jgi:hypothetical protein